ERERLIDDRRLGRRHRPSHGDDHDCHRPVEVLGVQPWCLHEVAAHDQDRALEGGGHADGATSSSAMFSSSTFTRGSPRNPRSRPLVYWSISRITWSNGSPRSAAMRGAWN